MLAIPLRWEQEIIGALLVRRTVDRRVPRPHGRAARDAREPVRGRHPQRAHVPRAPGQVAPARGRQPAQVRVPREHVARAAHAAQRGHRVLRRAARAHVRRAQRAPGRVPARHPRLRPAPARADQRDPRPLQGRGGAGWSSTSPACRSCRCSSTGSRWSASAPTRPGIALELEADAERRHRLRRRAQAQAGRAQPADQRGEVHRRRRLGRRGRAARRRRAPQVDGPRHRHRDRRGRPRARSSRPSSAAGAACGRARRAPASASRCRSASSSSTAAGCGWRAASARAALFGFSHPRRAPRRPLRPRRPAPPTRAGRTAARTVVVIDDDPLDLDLVEAVLAPEGYTVARAADGAEGVRLVRQRAPARRSCSTC